MASSLSKSKAKSKNRKIFKERLSLFEHLCLVNPYFNGIYMVVKVQFVFFIIYLIARDSVRARRFHFDISKDVIILGGFRDWLVFSAVECIQLLLCMLMYFTFLAWIVLCRWVGKLAHFLYFTSLVVYVCSISYFVWVVVHSARIATAPKLIAFLELIRLVMKTYAFVHDNVYKVLYPWHKDDDFGPAVWYAGQMSPQVASFSQYLYFLFAPTLLYRDHYPKRHSISWINVLLYMIQFLGAYVVSRFMFMEVQFPVSMRLDDLVYASLTIFLSAPFMNFLCCILILNAWFNLTAELTKFADREFYQNWWSAQGYSEYYRLWNIPIHDFLLEYVYHDLSQLIPHRFMAMLPTMILSSLLHDFITGVSMGFFAPTFMILFATIGGIVLVSGVRFSKFMTFMLTNTGIFLFETFYIVEIAARQYCPDEKLGHFEYQTLFCFHQYNNDSVSFF